VAARKGGAKGRQAGHTGIDCGWECMEGQCGAGDAANKTNPNPPCLQQGVHAFFGMWRPRQPPVQAFWAILYVAAWLSGTHTVDLATPNRLIP